ncbi:MAG: response regulator, partial [Bdellovibrionales bacterium]|nr:response regulator [Bdellovibrionales bacterium]
TEECADGYSHCPHIVFADDCPHSRTLIELALDTIPSRITSCDSGEKAMTVLSDCSPDLVILDVQMPGATGIEVCQWLKRQADRPFVPVMLLTAAADVADKVHGLDCGADEYMTKPFELPELAARARALLRIKHLTDRLRQTQDLLKEKERELVASHVAGAAAHELGQPLTALLLNCELLQTKSSTSDTLTDVLLRITQQCDIMRSILAQLNSVTQYRTLTYLKDQQILDVRASHASDG